MIQILQKSYLFKSYNFISDKRQTKCIYVMNGNSKKTVMLIPAQ